MLINLNPTITRTEHVVFCPGNGWIQINKHSLSNVIASSIWSTYIIINGGLGSQYVHTHTHTHPPTWYSGDLAESWGTRASRSATAFTTRGRESQLSWGPRARHVDTISTTWGPARTLTHGSENTALRVGHACECVLVCMRVCSLACVCMCVCVLVYMCLRVCAVVCVWLHASLYTCVCMLACVCGCVRLHACVRASV